MYFFNKLLFPPKLASLRFISNKYQQSLNGNHGQNCFSHNKTCGYHGYVTHHGVQVPRYRCHTGIQKHCFNHHGNQQTIGCHRYSTSNPGYLRVLGIETSCDDTGVAIVDTEGQVLGEALNSQTRIHVDAGGINPPVARDLHKQNIHQVVTQALHNANMKVSDVDGIACTTRPGLVMSLCVGLEYAKELVRSSGRDPTPINFYHSDFLCLSPEDAGAVIPNPCRPTPICQLLYINL